MHKDGVPAIKKWESTGKLVYAAPDGVRPSGHKLTTYWTLLDQEFKPKTNKFISIVELFSKKQGTTPLNEWITKIYNLVELCEYTPGNEKNRILQDILFLNCESTRAKDKIIRHEPEAQLNDVFQIL